VDVTHTYHYDGEEGFTVGPLNLSLCQGDLVFIVGGNGSGKTTLAKLLVGLYAPETGSVHLDGQIINDDNRESYRQFFSVVHSDFYLFDRLLGLEASDLGTRAAEYLNRFYLSDKVKIVNNRLSTTELSYGQRKRLALLTAFLEDRPIYVFDEWAADQDPLFKKLFYYRFLPDLKARGKTVAVISHDDFYYNVADRVIKLDCGRIASEKINAAASTASGEQVISSES
jgi:putative ATP-binding cassette transporter